jgi:Protein of unknown function (DUF4229)
MTESTQTESDKTQTEVALDEESVITVTEDEPQAPSAALNTKHAALRYTTLRLALFVVALGVVWVIARIADMDLNSQTSKLSLLAVAILLSSAVSFVVLSKQRDAMSAGLVARSQKLSQKLDRAASFEDE